MAVSHPYQIATDGRKGIAFVEQNPEDARSIVLTLTTEIDDKTHIDLRAIRNDFKLNIIAGRLWGRCAVTKEGAEALYYALGKHLGKDSGHPE